MITKKNKHAVNVFLFQFFQTESRITNMLASKELEKLTNLLLIKQIGCYGDTP